MAKFEFMHFRSKDVTRGGATIAILPQATSKTALIAISRCGPNDVFNKKIGRSIASGRINAFLTGRPTDQVAQIVLNDDDNLKDVVAAEVAEQMMDYGLL